jgi:hypothetical protein
MGWKFINGPRSADHPLVCVDESSKQLVKETRTPIKMKPGQPWDNPGATIMNTSATALPISVYDVRSAEGWRCVKATDRHAAVDYARVLKELSDVRSPDAEKIVLVQDNLSTHAPAALHEAFPGRRSASTKQVTWHRGPPCYRPPRWPFNFKFHIGNTRQEEQATEKANVVSRDWNCSWLSRGDNTKCVNAFNGLNADCCRGH